MTRTMIDCTHENIPNVNLSEFDIVAYYVTGSSTVKWTIADIALIPPSKVQVTIDQGFTGSPVAPAIIRDVEPNAWTPAHAINDTPWTPPRPTIYSDEVDSVSVVNDGWTGDYWLAYPFNSPPTKDLVLQMFPHLRKVNLVAVQWKFTNTHDESVVFDNNWPKKGTVIMPVVQYPNFKGSWLGPVDFKVSPTGHVVGIGYGLDFEVYYVVSTDFGKTYTDPTKL